jgi:hypothetical protein
MPTSHPRWASNKLFASLFATSLAVALACTFATDPAVARRSASASTRSQVRHAAFAVKAAKRSLASSAWALKICEQRHPRRCAALRHVVRRASHRLAIRRRRLSKLTRHGKTQEATRWVHPASPPSASPASRAPVPPPPAGGLLSSKIIGTNDGAGWGSGAAKTIIAGHITWNRVEIGMDSNTIAESRSDGFHTLAILGNVDDNTPLDDVDPSSWGTTVVSQLQANPGISIAEAGNEMYFKGNVANPVQYGRMYLAAVNAIRAAGIHTPLLFNMIGDYHLGTWSAPTGYSEDAHGGGWLHDAVAGVPGLAAAILANGLSTHPYGALGENHNDTNGVNAVAAQEAVAQTVLGATPPIYITEFGYSLNNCGESNGACSQAEQASKMLAAYTALLADPHVAGIWCYQSHDDATGQFGFMNDNDTTRPLFETLSSIAVEQGQ